MKKILLLIPLGLLIINANAQLAKSFTPQKIGKFHHEWNPTPSEWIMEDSASYTYNLLGQLSEEISYYGDYPFNGTWYQASKTSNSYNNNGDIAEKITLFYNGASWDSTQKTTYTYNGNNKLTNMIDYQFTSSGLLPFSKAIKTYDGNGNLLTDVIHIWDTVSNSFPFGDSDQLNTYTYDGNNHITSHLQQSYDTATSSLKNMLNDLIITNGAGLPFKTTHQVWAGTEWYDIEKDSTFYNSNSIITKNFHSYRHQRGTDHWGIVYKEVYSYSSSGKITEYLSQPFDTLSSTYKNDGRIEYLYNSDDNMTKTTMQIWDTLASSYRQQIEDYFYYSSPTLSIKNNKQSEFKMYPNPCRNHLFIKTDLSDNCKVSVYDISGKELIVDLTNKNNLININTENLKQGVYFIQIKSQNTIYSEKFIKLD